MNEYQILTVLAAFAFLYSLVASRLERTPISGAFVYVAAGLLLGPAGLKLVDFDVDAEGISWLAELTLAVVLFTDSANADLNVLRRFEKIPIRLLLLGLPLTIALGFGIGAVLFRELSLFEVALRSPDENNLPVRPTGKKEFVGNWRIESGVQSVGMHFLQFPTNSFFPPRVVYRVLGGMSKSGPYESVLIFDGLPTRKAPHEMGRRLI